MILDRIADDPAASPTGVYYASGHPKEGAKAVATAAANAQLGLTVCPGLASPAVASTMTFPTQLASSAPTQVQVGCVRNCLYLVTLDDAAGRPVVATRGVLQGGAVPVTVTLPQARIAPGTYRVDVRLASEVNPGSSPACSARRSCRPVRRSPYPTGTALLRAGRCSSPRSR